MTTEKTIGDERHNQDSPSAPSEFRAGLLVILPAMAAATPFAFLLGALAADRGFSPVEAGLMSAFVFAGSAQFIALDTWQSPAPWLLIGIATFVVNLRHVFMSASILRSMGSFSPFKRISALFLLADEIWAFAEARASERRLTPAFYAGLAVLFYINWVVSTLLGALAGNLISDPRAFGFDFAFTAIFIGLVMGFRNRPGFAPTVFSSAITATAVHLIYPGPVSIVAGALAGIVVAAVVGPADKKSVLEEAQS